jgi:hypothetical protein
MFAWLQSLLGAAPRRRPPGHRPSLEPLETRAVPARAGLAAPSQPPHFAVAVDAAGTQHLFVLGLDGQVYEQNDSPSGTPTSGYFLLTPGRVKAFSVTTDSANDLHLFAVGLDDQVYQVLFDAAGRAVSPYRLTRSGRVKSVTASQDNTNDPEIFVIGLDNQVYTLAFNADGSILGSTPSSTPNYTLTAPGPVKSVAAAQPGPLQNPELFVVRPDNQVYEALAPGAIGTYGPYRAQVPGAVKSLSVTPDSAGDLHLFVLGLDNQVYQALFDGNGNAVMQYRLTAPGQVKAIATGQSALSHPLLFAIGLDSQVATLGFNDDGSLLKETPHYVLTTPGQVRAITLGRANGRAAIFAVGLDGQVYESVSTSFPAYQPYRLAAPGWIK